VALKQKKTGFMKSHKEKVCGSPRMRPK